MSTLRALGSVLLLAGFYVLAVALLVAGAAASVWASGNGYPLASWVVGAATLAYAVVMALAFWRARPRRTAPGGVLLDRAAAPELWTLVDGLAEVAQTPGPDEIRLVADVNAGVSEDARLLGLLPGRRRLYVGAPLLLGLDVSGMTTVLAHELGHYSRRHTRLGAVAYRGRVAVVRAVRAIDDGEDPVGKVLRRYAELYLTVSSSVARRQEHEADALSVQLAGRAAAQDTLRELEVIDAAWRFYLEAYLRPGWSAGVVPEPDQVLGGFGELLAARHDELARVREKEPSTAQDRWDTHPATATRIAAMAQMPDPGPVRDARPAADLVLSLLEAAAGVAADVVPPAGRRVVAWPDLTATAVAAPGQRSADVAYRAVAQLAGVERATLETVLGLVETGRGADLLDAVRPDALTGGEDGVVRALRKPLAALVHAALLQAGALRWQHSWAVPARLVRADGTPVDGDGDEDAREIAALAAAPGTVAEARERLAALGVDTTAVGQVDVAPTAHGARVISVLADVEVDGALHDVVLLDLGLLMVASPSRTVSVRDRSEALLTSAPLHELARQHRYLAFEQVRGATVLKRMPVHVDLATADGGTVRVRGRLSSSGLTKDAVDVALRVFDELASRTSGRDPAAKKW